MATSFELNAEMRTNLGKAATRRLRRMNDAIPAIIYGAGKDVQTITLDHKKVAHALENEAFYSHILTLNINGAAEKAILRDIQRHPVKAKILHMDFQRISATEKLTMNIPLHFKGEELAPGVSEGGVISHMQSTIEITCLPANLPEYIEVDVSKLAMGETIHLSNLTLPKGVESAELTRENDLPIVSIHMPRVVEEEPASTEIPSAEVPTVSETENPEDEEGKE
jgi:large subunit ribosomal protein L25